MNRDASYIGKTAYHGEVAANYDRDRVNEPVWQREQAWVEMWSQRVPAGAVVLDVPAGTGRFVGILRARGARVHAVDISEDMLAELRARWAPDGSALVVARGDAEALAYAADTFEFAICWRLFHLVPPETAERVVRELARVCRGQIVLEVFGVERGGPIIAAVRAIKRRLRALVPRAGGGDAKPWSHITNFPHRETDLRAMFARCGLRVAGEETLADYQGRPARVYLLERERAGA